MEMLGQSGVMTLLGMGIVFGFLIIMIIAVSTVGKVISMLSLGKDAGSQAGGAGLARGSSGTGNNAAVTAAISAAVNEYRKNN
jgi:oxaloacetate decarboxylase gamma subunit